MRINCLLLACLFIFTGCVGPMTFREAKLPDGAVIRAYRAPSMFAPSVTVVAVRSLGTTNWTITETFAGPGIVPGASTGGGIAAAGALLRPDRSKTSVTATGGAGGAGGEATASQGQTATPSRFPPGNAYGNRGR